MPITIAYKDIEDIIDDILDRMRDSTYGLNAAIAAINTQKASVDAARGRVVMTLPKFTNIATPAVDTLTEGQNLFFFMAEEFVNCDPFMVVTIPTWTTDNMGTESVSVMFLIVMEDPSDGTDPKRKLLRYVRALKEVFRHFPLDSDLITETKTSIVEPDLISINAGEQSLSYYSAGVKLELVYA
jgi:hypothetical protein